MQLVCACEREIEYAFIAQNNQRGHPQTTTIWSTEGSADMMQVVLVYCNFDS